MRISSLSTEYVYVPVYFEDVSGTQDPTAGTASMAFVAEGEKPATGDWDSATWETSGDDYWVAALADLERGRYSVWVRVELGNETVVKRAGQLEVI